MWTALWAVYIIWGSTYLAIAIAGETIPPLLAVSTRFIAAGAIMAGDRAVARRHAADRPARARLVRRRSAACCRARTRCSSSPSGTSPTGLASLIIASVPLLGRGAAPGRGREAARRDAGRRRRRLRRRRGAAAAVGRRDRARASALCLLSAVMWAVGSFAAARVTMPDDPFTATTYEMLAGGLVMLPFGLVTTARLVLAVDRARSSRGSTSSRSARSSATRRTRGCSTTRRSARSRPTRT